VNPGDWAIAQSDVGTEMRQPRSISESGATVEIFCLFRESGLQSAAPKAKNQMSSKTPKPRFKHRTVRGMPQRVESYCTRCEQFVGASDKPQALKIAEKAHACVKIESLRK